MIQAVFEKELNKTTIRMPAPEADSRSYPLRLLLSGRAAVLLPCSMRRIDDKEYLVYDTSGLRPLKAVLARGCLAAPAVRECLLSLLAAWEALSDTLLPAEEILSAPEYLFEDPGTGALRLLYYPGPPDAAGLSEMQPFADFAEALANAADPNDPEAVVLAFRFRALIRGGDAVPKSLAGLLALPEPEDPKAAPLPALPPSGPPSAEPVPAFCPAAFPDAYTDDLLPETQLRDSRPAGKPARKRQPPAFLRHLLSVFRKKKREKAAAQDTVSLEEIFLLPDHDETEQPTVLFSEPEKGPALLPDGHTYGMIRLEKETVTIGKLPSAADAVIPHPTVSRIHARIFTQNGEWYIEDLGSRNGTHVNEKEVSFPGREKIKDGDRIRFAAVTYTFRT